MLAAPFKVQNELIMIKKRAFYLFYNSATIITAIFFPKTAPF